MGSQSNFEKTEYKTKDPREIRKNNDLKADVPSSSDR